MHGLHYGKNDLIIARQRRADVLSDSGPAPGPAPRWHLPLPGAFAALLRTAEARWPRAGHRRAPWSAEVGGINIAFDQGALKSSKIRQMLSGKS